MGARQIEQFFPLTVYMAMPRIATFFSSIKNVWGFDYGTFGGYLMVAQYYTR